MTASRASIAWRDNSLSLDSASAAGSAATWVIDTASTRTAVAKPNTARRSARRAPTIWIATILRCKDRLRSSFYDPGQVTKWS
ncbi:hypothetical protein MPUL_23110 [Mycolicibacterium pulveris]|uniref:Uncharacterized protein n=1 Tax=Mycolicibacterium pulveris TaxID=36813 RepID=A0A7I7UK38_MYCPV|nr:hypothetical protein MPUL_23110 [Mycolicibacterium pulveris]